MTSIYRNLGGKNDREQSRSGSRSRSRSNQPARSGLTRQQLELQKSRRQEQLNEDQSQQLTTYNDYPLFATVHSGKHHLLEFKIDKKIDPITFTGPIKLYRKQSSHDSSIRKKNQQKYQKQIKQSNKSDDSHPSSGHTVEKNEGLEEIGILSSQQQSAIKTNANVSLISPMGGAVHNKKMMFKRRTKEIYFDQEDSREIKKQEEQPWILEDNDAQNSFTGMYEGGQRSDYFFFVITDNGFKVVPMSRWYKFQPKRTFKQLSLEEAEEKVLIQMKPKNIRNTRRWVMLNRGMEERDQEGTSSLAQKKFREPNSNDDGRSFYVSDTDTTDFNDECQDDEEGVIEPEEEDMYMKESKERIRKEMMGSLRGSNREHNGVSFEDDIKLSSGGKELKRLLNSLGGNEDFASDEDDNPYVFSDEEIGSDSPENHNQKDTYECKHSRGFKETVHLSWTEKHYAIKQTASNPFESVVSSAHHEEVSVSLPLSSSQPTTSQNEIGKRKKGDEDNTGDAKYQSDKNTLFSVAAKTSSLDTMSTSNPSPGMLTERHITEEEVISALRGKQVTTKEFVTIFKKRIKQDQRNKVTLCAILKKVARHVSSTNDKVKKLQLKPKFQ